jgi:GT2 family glycosyltransferase
LECCLKSVYRAGIRSSFDVVVVDNGSTDGSQAMLREKFPEVRLIENQHNVGLGMASNQGIEATQGTYLLLLNNDTLVDGAALDNMVEFLDSHPNAGAVGGRLVNPDGSFQAGYADFSTLREEFLVASRLGEFLWKGYPSHADGSNAKSVGWLSSACLLLRRAALDEVGLLDVEYFIYGDETDLQYRLHRAGWPVYYLPSVSTIHYGGRSMDRWRRRKMVYRGKMLFYKKHYGVVKTSALRLMFAGLSAMKILIWGIALTMPSLRSRAKKELDSNIEVLQLCLRLQ